MKKLLLLIFSLIALHTSAAIKYVNWNATGANNGTSWNDAYTVLQSALISAVAGDEIWVAKGTYHPTVRAGDGTRDQDKAFVLVPNVKIFGGFAGTETDLAGRNWTTNTTILSGDLDNSGTLTNADAAHVVISSGAVGSAELNGFTITGGNVYVPSDSRIVNGLQISTSYGGGIYSESSAPKLINLIVYGNKGAVGNGHGIFVSNSDLMISNTVISNNGESDSQWGGGIYVKNSNPTLTNVQVTGNTALYGGGIYSEFSNLTITNAVFSGNGRMNAIETYSGTATLTNVTISGSMYGIDISSNTQIKVFNSIIYNNAIGIYTGILGTLLVSHSLVQGMTATTNGNINGSTNPLFVNPINPSFNATSSGDYHLQSGSPIRDLGSNTYYAAGLTPDLSSIKTGLDGNDRMMGNAPEPGAYELPMITTISTSPLTYITQNKAVLGGNVTADNGTMVTERGIVISASNTRPTISDTKIISGSGMGAFSAIAAGLSAGTLYHTRAYAINTEGTAYGNIIDFTTAPPPPNISYAAPQVYTKGTAITDISPSNTGGAVPATIYGTVTQTFAGYNSPLGIGKDGLGNIYCADTYNNVLKKIAASNGAITTLATGFNAPLDAATDIFGNIYVSDFLNHQIKKISTADGSIAIVANMNEPRSLIVDELSDIYVTDGPIVRKISGVLTSTPFSSSAFLTSIDKDVNGNLFIAVFGAREIRKRDVNGIITTIASGFSEPTGLSLDPAGNLYVADRSNKNVKRISVHDGSISTVGPGFDSPQDVECDDLGNLYITELNQGQIKKMTITGYTISPELPAGLVFDGTTGKISGTPTSILASTDYKITAYNASGSNQTTLNITVNDIPPSNLSYSTPNTFTRGTTISDLTPSVDGGTVVSYSISPALTAGLNLNTTTGVIGGTPANFSAATDYTVTATNSKGSTTTVVNITVNEIAPSGLIYNTSKTYAPGVAITDLTPVNTGGTITNYSVSPNFPAGLSLNPTTGVISGTPASLTPTANYTISAANSIGTTTAVITITVRNPKTLFVKWDASGANNGDSWTDAFTDLQTALEAAIPNDELWVAKGTYKPAKKAGNGATDQHKTFVLLPNVKIFGGFAGTEPDLASRDWKANTTILSGDIDNSGTQTNGVDAFHVVVSVGDVGTAELNGFTVTGGNSTIFDYGNNPDYLINGYGIHTYAGGGIYSESSSPKLTNLIIDRNTTRDYGGGIYNSGSNPIITNTVISNNSLPSAHLGGGIYNIDSNPIITNVSITGNHASGGGGMVNRQSSPILTNVVLSGNDRCAMENYGGVITLTNVTISGNVYAAMMNWQGVLINIRNSIIYNNSSGIVNNDNSSLTNYYSLIQGLSDTNNGNIDGNADPLFVNPLVPATTSDGDYHLQPGSPLNNMGSNSFFDSGQTPELSAIIRDLDGNGRIAGAAIDLGAYEMLISADVTTSGLTALEGNNATIAGEVTSDSGNQVSERGIVLSSSNTIPMLSDTKVSSGSGTGFFYATASGLNPATLYYVRAYATNAAGTSYGSVISFMTRPPLPAIAYSAPQIYQKGTTVTAISPSNTGGTVPATVYGAVTETFTGFNNPNGAGKDGAGNMYIADTDNKLIKKISSIDGAITPASGNTKFPYDVAIDGNGDINMIISNNTQYDNRMVVRAYGLSEYIGGDTVLGATRLVTDALLDRYVANGRGLKRVTSGRGYPFYNGGKIISVEKDANGNFFMGDDATGEIQKMDINQAVTILGSGFSHPTGISADLSGNLYIADHGNSQVKKISVHDGTISIIGSGFDAPGDVECDDLGNLYVTEPGQNVVKKIAITGYTISPELPAGLAFDGKTGEISGTPTGISASADYTITAFNASGSNQTTLNITVNDVAPSSLSYQIPSAFQAGTAISDLTPTVSGGAVTAYSISPALPAGLNIDSQTGIISGTPSQFSPVLNYTVTAANSGGSITAVIRISVAVSSPVIAYNGPQTYTVNDAITSLSPVNTGGTIPSSPPTYTIGSDYGRLNDIALDAAGNMYLSIDGADYIPKIIKLSGTDGSLSTIATHTNQRFLGLALDASGNVYYAETSPGGLTSPIKRRTADGANTVTIASGFNHIQSLVVDAAGNIYFADRGNNAIGKIDVSTSQVTYFGPPLEFSHPFGVALDVAGNIYVSDTDHRAVKKISAIDGSITTIATGFTPIDLTIDATGNVYVAAEQGPVRRIDAANGSISTLAYSNFLTGLTVDPSGALYGVDNTDAIVSKLFRTGYFVSPALPAGLTIDNNTGIISGTPTAPTELNMYTITGFNESGSHSTSLDIAVIDVAPSELDYTTPNVFTKGTAITSLSPTVSGGAVTSYSISPALPTGLSFSTTTGVISGTPTVLKTATDYTVTATNTGGNTTASLNITVNDVTPSALSYTTPNVFTKGTAITSLSPTISGGAVTSYSISPALPTGLSLSTTTGVISGTPTTLSSAADYTVTATNTGGNTTASLNITVNDVIPSALSYTTPNVFTKGTAITSLSPTISGGAVTSYSISPALPTGLSLSTTTGVISGTPTLLKTATDYTVTATNTGGNTTASLNITVNDVTPSALSYTTPNVFTKGTAITSLSPTVSGGAVTSYSISPALPTGLSFSTTTGVISGTPTVLKTATDYTVTATNTGGNTTASLNITVNDVTPSALSYTTPNVFTKGTAITSLSPTVSGGAVTSYSIAPALPTGLSFSTTTGIISGTPTTLSSAADYTVTATNTGGNTTASLNITVNDVTPSALSYTTPNVFTKGTAITSLSPTVSGGAVTSYSISPALPTGLNFNTTTGVISGTPTLLKTATDYTVTATNSGGSTTFAVNIAVIDVIPSSLSYTTQNIFTKGTDITSLSPTISGGAITSYSISPALPTGLSFSTTTGVISGTPTVLKTATDYTVTATNSGGSTTFAVNITVNDVTPSALSYTTPNVFTRGTAITSLSPTVSGGAVTSYSISPALPTGLNFSTTTGVISGTPSVLKTATDYTVTATNSGGSTTFAVNITVNDVIPSALSYTTPNVFTKGSAITSLSPTISGGAVTSYSISPALPAGLNFNTTTGVISGTPSVLKTAADYTVTAANSGGSTTFAVNITVNDLTPSALSYTTPNIFTKGTAITSLSPTVNGGVVTSYSITPALPAGLNFSTTTGVISGTPTVIKTAADYTVTATNSGGSTTFAVNITVNDVVPSALSYTTPNIFTKGTAITSLSPTVNGGVVTSYSITPALPAGLNFSTTTGVISGTPTVIKTAADYTVTATNSGGSTTFAVNITVNDVVPSALSYTTPNIFTKGTAITSLSPTVNGGVVTSYSISPALPAGLNFSTTTGVISGTPTIIKTASNYTVTATNTGGNTTASVRITVNDIIPSALSYTTPNVFTKGTAITSLSPTISGGAVTSYSISTVLPTGLNFNTTTGVMSGTPSVLKTATDYTVTATNSGGSTTFAVSITVNDVIPSALSYTTPNVFTKGSAITSLSPTISGGAVTSYSIAPALPTGLNFNTTTGVISGTPTVLKTATDYTVTAINSGGSTTFTVNITVNDVIPSALNYTTPNVFTKGTAITSLSPTVSGGAVTSYSISATLPTGLSFSTTTGVISGTPTVLKTAADYTVTATNSGGSTTFAVNIAVIDVTPSALSYTTPNIFTKGTAITSLSPTVSGGAITSYSISPALPTGLSFSTTTGVISGTPSVLKTVTNYTVTATNTGGNTTASLNIAVNDVIPSALSYTTPNVFTRGTAITSLSPTVSGGAVTSYSISPALPAGLSLNATTGIISGTPAAISPTVNYTVTAANSGGNTTALVSITINSDVTMVTWSAPADLIYGTALSAIQLNASAAIPGTFKYSPEIGTLLHSGTGQMLSVTFRPDNPLYPVSTQSVTINILKAPLRVVANNVSRCYGTQNPALTMQFTGFVNNENEAQIIIPSIASAADLQSAAGTYPITLTGGTAANYTLELVPGTLTVNPLPIVTITSDKGNSIKKGETIHLNTSGNANTYSWTNPDGLISGQGTASISVRPSKTTTFELITTNATGCSSTQTITIEVTEDYSLVKGTNILSNNGDGRNDTWIVRNIDMYPDNTVTIMDRAGRQIYKTKGYQNDWKGMLNGSPLKEGTYYYFIDLGNYRPIIKGFISIINE